LENGSKIIKKGDRVGQGLQLKRSVTIVVEKKEKKEEEEEENRTQE
jgi:hypothetical protein